MRTIKEIAEAWFQKCYNENWEEGDALKTLLDIGFTLDDFKYNETRYEWVKRVAEDYGIV